MPYSDGTNLEMTMKENMVLKSSKFSIEMKEALAKQAQALGVDGAVVLRDLLNQYVSGTLTLPNNCTGPHTSRFYVPPDLLAVAETKAEAQGYSVGELVGRLVDKALVQNPQGETHEN